MPLQLVVANPPRRRRKTKKKARTRRASRRTTVARRKPARRRRRRSTAAAPARRRRRSSRSSFGGTTKILSMGTVKLAAYSTGGFIAANMLPDKLGISQLQTGYGRVAGRALVGIVGGMVLPKIIGKAGAAAFATGALTAAGVELYGQIQARRGVSGFEGQPLLGFEGGMPLLGMDGANGVGQYDTQDALAGLGAFDFDE